MRIDFYHLEASPVEKALPQLLGRVLASGARAIVMAASDDRLEVLSNVLWTSDPNSWLPHGTKKDGAAALQPVWLTTVEENPNGARMLVLTDGMESSRMGEFERCLDLFDGTNDEATTAARTRWSAAKAAGHELHYWQQTDTSWKEQGA